MSQLRIRPCTFALACAFVTIKHRHHLKPQGHKFSVCCVFEGKTVGVAMVGRPVARNLDNGLTVEVTRLCTDGTKNACSKMYSACRRIAFEMGYDKIVTYILESETGHSLLVSGWDCEGEAGGGAWRHKGGVPRKNEHPLGKKTRWTSTNPLVRSTA